MKYGEKLPKGVHGLPDVFTDHGEGVCSTPECECDLDEERDRLCEQADYHGMASLTEQQQAFLEGAQQGLCPDCME